MAALYTFLGAFVYGVVYTVWLEAAHAGSTSSSAASPAASPCWPAPRPSRRRCWRRRRCGSRWCCFSGRRRTSGASRSHVATTIRRRACRCCRPSSAMRAPRAPCSPERCCSSPRRSCRRFVGLSWIYAITALGSGAYFLWKSVLLVRDPWPRTAMANFHASLVQLTLLLTAAIADAPASARERAACARCADRRRARARSPLRRSTTTRRCGKAAAAIGRALDDYAFTDATAGACSFRTIEASRCS